MSVEEMETKLSRLSELSGSDRQMRFTSVIHLVNEENLNVCFWELKRKSAPGVDWVSWTAYREELEENISRLCERMRRWQYRPQAVRRVYRPKANGTKRPLGIPAIEDKMVQMLIPRILVAVYEPLFLDCSYGFRQHFPLPFQRGTAGVQVVKSPQSETQVLMGNIQQISGEISAVPA